MWDLLKLPDPGFGDGEAWALRVPDVGGDPPALAVPVKLEIVDPVGGDGPFGVSRFTLTLRTCATLPNCSISRPASVS